MSSDPRRDLTVLRELVETLARATALEYAIFSVTDAALALLPADHASVRVLDATRTQLLSSARSGAGLEREPLPIAKGEGVAGWVLEHSLPAYVPNTAKDSRFIPSGEQGFTIGSIIAEPLMSAGHAIGVLSVSAAALDAFSQDDILLARILAHCSVPVIDKTRSAHLVSTDEVTAAFNATYLLPRLSEELLRAKHGGSSLSLLMIHLDRLDQLGASFGRGLRDAVLATFAARVRQITRQYDTLVRCGDDRFALVLPTTSPSQSQATAEQLRRVMADELIEPKAGARMTQTVSIGVATWDRDEKATALVERAGAAMLEAAGASDAVVRAKSGSGS